MGAGVVKKQRRGRGRSRSQPMAEINVTPFVDVMLVLLIIFMVAAPMLTVGVPLELPRTAAQSVPSEPEEPLSVSVTPEGPIMVMNSEVPEDELISRLRAVAAERESNRIYLRADGSITYSRIMQVMGALNAAGFNNIVLVTETGGPRMNGQPEG